MVTEFLKLSRIKNERKKDKEMYELEETNMLLAGGPHVLKYNMTGRLQIDL